jgi:hypothetical protein
VDFINSLCPGLKTGFDNELRGILLEENTKILIDSLCSKSELVFSVLANIASLFCQSDRFQKLRTFVLFGRGWCK